MAYDPFAQTQGTSEQSSAVPYDPFASAASAAGASDKQAAFDPFVKGPSADFSVDDASAPEKPHSWSLEAAGVADFVLGIPSQIAKVTATTASLIGQEAAALTTGQSPGGAKEMLQTALAEGEEKSKYIQSPAERLMRLAGVDGSTYIGQGMEKVSEVAGKAAEAAGTELVPSEAYQAGLDVLMTGLGVKGTDVSIKFLKRKAEQAKEPPKNMAQEQTDLNDFFKEAVADPTPPEATPEVKDTLHDQAVKIKAQDAAAKPSEEQTLGDAIYARQAEKPLPEAPNKATVENVAPAESTERRAAPRGEDRRKDSDTRKRISDMDIEEARKALATDALTGVGSRRAWEDTPKKPYMATLDLDGFKWINDEMGHEIGDDVLRKVGDSFKAAGVDAYRLGGDEFWIHGDTPEALHGAMTAAQDYLKNVKVSKTGTDGITTTKHGIEFSYGVADSMEAADAAMLEHKAVRTEAGLRKAGRGEEPTGVTRDSETGHYLPLAQAGMAKPDMLKYLGMASLGAAGGALLDPQHPLGAAILGGIGGAALMALPKAIAAIPGHWKAAAAGGVIGYAESDEHPYAAAAIAAVGARYLHIKMKPETAPYVQAADKLVSENINNKAAYARVVWNLQTAINKMVPDKERLNNISRYMDGSAHTPLTKEEMSVADAAKQFFDSTGKAAVDAGVLKGLRENYVSHIIDWSGKTDQEIASIRQMIFGDLNNKGATISGSSKFTKQRKYDTFDELNTVLAKYGVKLKTENVSEIIGIYGNSMRRAIEDKRLIDQLKAIKDTRGRPLIDSPSRENTDYTFIPTSSLQNLRVHPEIAPALKVIADSKDDGALGALHALAMGLKRIETVSTLFHAAALVDVAVGAGTFKTTMRSIASGTPGLNKFVKSPEVLDQYRKGSISDDISTGMKQGLTFTKPADLDPTSINSVARQVGKWADNVLPTKGAGEKLGAAMSAFNQAIDSITWEHAYTGTKLAIFQKEMEKALLDNAKARQSNPSIPELTKEQAAAHAATFANDLTGGQNWFQMATATKSALARKLALTAVSKRGMMLQQIAMFAPDWTVSTFKSMYKGIGSMLPKELGLPGVPTEDLLRGMYRRYALRSLTAYMMIGNAVNYAYSGHSVFENKDSSGKVDPTFIDMGDGRKMYLSKHSTEFFKWMEHPSQELLNKVGSIPSEVATQATGTEYLTTDPKKAQPIGDRLAHLASKFVPMPITAGIKGGAVAALSSFIGRPIYGKTTAQREQERMDKRTQIKPMKLSDMMK